MSNAPHGGLQRIDLRHHDGQIEHAQQLGHAAHDENIRGLAAALGRLVQFSEPALKQSCPIAIAAADDVVCLGHEYLKVKAAKSRRTPNSAKQNIFDERF